MADFQDVSGLSADDTMAQLELQRRLKMAQALQQEAMPQGQMVSGHFVAPSFTQYGANLLNKYIAGKTEDEALAKFGEYNKAKQSKLSEAFDAYLKGKEPIAETQSVDNYVSKPYAMGANIPTSMFKTTEQLTQTSPSFNTQNMPEQMVNQPITSTTYRQPTRTEQLANITNFLKKSGNTDMLNKVVLGEAENLFKTPESVLGKIDVDKFDPQSVNNFIASGNKDYSLLKPIAKPETAGSLEKDYTFAKSQGFKGGIEDFKRVTTNYINPYQQAQIDMEKSGLFNPSTVNMLADQALAGDKSVLQGLGRGKQGAENIKLVRDAINQKMLERGWNGADIAAKNAEFMGLMAGERTVGTKGANIEIAGNEFINIVPIAKQASDNVARSGFLPFGKAQIMFDEQTNNVELSKFAAANNGLVNTYARAISPTGVPTVEDKRHARQILSEAKDQSAYNAAVDTLVKEIEAAKKAPKQVRENLRNEISGNSGTSGTNASGAKVMHWNDLPNR